MQVNIFGHILAALALVTVGTTLGTSAQAAAQPASKPAAVRAAVPQAPVVVKLGSAMLEEYCGGDPAQRTTTYRDGETSQNPAAGKTESKPQG